MTETSAPPSKALFSAGEIGGMIGGACKGNLDSLVRSVVADSRKVLPGSLFVALPGERVDGHDFVTLAFEKGATCALVGYDKKDKVLVALGNKIPADACLIFVDSPLAGLQALAREHRRRMKTLFRIGITGSSGKTTTKECVGAALSRAYPEGSLVMNEGNLNSDIGLALSMFSLEESHKVGIFEMGMNRIGEMDELAAIYEPDMAIITNIGTAHIGIIGSRQGIAQEKKKIFSRFTGSQCGFVWDEDAFAGFLEAGVAGRVMEFGLRSTKGLENIENLGLRGWNIRWCGENVQFPLPGKHNLLDALAALSVAAELNLDASLVAKGLSTVQPLFGRSEIFEGRIALVRDCYNANPDSVAAAIDLCDSVEGKGRKVYILGSMLELGESSVEEHTAMGRRAGNSRADALFFFGAESGISYEEAMTVEKARSAEGRPGQMIYHTDDIESLKKTVLAFVMEGDLVLAKASRGLALERLTDALFDAGLVASKKAESVADASTKNIEAKGGCHAS
jgi:UDP-N-acetylmuramoyl-tripeptide--D-alanyl-D-alanine ligase